MEAPTIWIGTDDLPTGAVVLLYGAGADGQPDYTLPERGGHARVRAPDEHQGTPAAAHAGGPTRLGATGTLRRPVRLAARPRVFGQFTYGVVICDPTTYEKSAAAAAEVSAFVSAEPRPPTALMPYAALDAGRCKFALAGDQLHG